MILVHLQRNWPETGAPADLRGKKWNTTVHFIIICSTNKLWISLFCGSRSHQTESISLSLVCHAHRQAAHSFSAMMVFCVRYKAAVCSLLMYISMWFVVVSFGCLSVGYKYVFGMKKKTATPSTLPESVSSRVICFVIIICSLRLCLWCTIEMYAVPKWKHSVFFCYLAFVIFCFSFFNFAEAGGIFSPSTAAVAASAFFSLKLYALKNKRISHNFRKNNHLDP